MGDIKSLADTAFRNFVSDGVPASGANEPDKTAIRQVFATIDSQVASLAGTVSSGRKAYATYAELSGTSGPAGTVAEVPLSDTGTHTDPVVGGTVKNSGIFAYSTSPAGWKRIYDYPDVRNPAAVALTQTNSSDNYFICQSDSTFANVSTFSLEAPSDRGTGELNGVLLEVTGYNGGDPRQVRYYPGDPTKDQVGENAWTEGDVLLFGALTADGWFPLIYPPRPALVEAAHDDSYTNYNAMMNGAGQSLAAIGL